jgi:hypothetical protein
MCELWVGTPWTIAVDNRGVSITYASGDQVYRRRMSRADYRMGLETSLRQLNEYEARERCEVLPIKRSQRGH